jgi:hypothetical protein
VNECISCAFPAFVFQILIWDDGLGPKEKANEFFLFISKHPDSLRMFSFFFSVFWEYCECILEPIFCNFVIISPIVIEMSDYHPSYAFVLLLMRWMRKAHTHYFLDIQNCCEGMATELGHSVSTIIKSRGWQLCWNDDDTTSKIQYQRLLECIATLEGDHGQVPQGHIGHTKAVMISGLYRTIDKANLLHQPKHVKKNRKVAAVATNRRKQEHLDKFGRERIHIHEEASFSSRVSLSHQHLQMAYLLVHHFFYPVLPIFTNSENGGIMHWVTNKKLCISVMTYVWPSPKTIQIRNVPSTARTHVSFYTRLDERFNSEKCWIATFQDTQKYMPRVVIKGTAYDIHMYCTPIEFYSIKGLRDLEHAYHCSDPQKNVFTQTVPPLDIGPTVSMITKWFTILRMDDPIFFLHNFEALSISLGGLATSRKWLM